MPKVKRSRKPPPDGWELIEPTLDELDQKMREGKTYFLLANNVSHLS
ncbi:protein BUD31 homolog [Salmo salar]|uniref:BUD31 homolog n=1 Tax=Salmo salar TaxID=8030 RepID=B9EN74_SALSA|nr:protein BUD31 homolog [Salmo salar]ACM08971.1 BUD31 homolog [Salmo salar]ACM09327.1 BUD31 homolog [Salmo salar]|eukprot:NP_001140032.1 protein BUD31 homolog [Salmo salar]